MRHACESAVARDPAFQQTALMMAVREARGSTVELLIARGADVWSLLREKHERRVRDERAKPLAAYRDQLTVVSQLTGPVDGHAVSVASWLSGTIPKRTTAEDVLAGVESVRGIEGIEVDGARCV